MKRKVLCLMLSIAVVFSFMPFFTVQADAFSTGARLLVKARTVTIKPGRTYKSPTFKMATKMAVTVPCKVKSSGDITKGGLRWSIKTYKGTNKFTYTQSLVDLSKGEIFDFYYYAYANTVANPGFAKGSYYITLKNTTNRTIRVNYSVRGYSKIASTAELPKAKRLNQDQYQLLGKIGPGVPLVKSVTCSNKNVELYWYVDRNGSLFVAPYAGKKDTTAYIYVKLLNRKTNYKIKTIINGYS